MAGFGDIFTPIHNWVDPRRNALAGLGAGLLQGRPGAGVQEGIAQDDAYATMKKAEAERQAQINQTQQWLRANYPQYASLPVTEGWQAAMADMAAKRAANPGPTANMRDFTFAQQNPGFADFLNGSQGSNLATGFTPIPGTYNGKETFAFPGNDGRYYIDGQPVAPGAFTPSTQYTNAANKAAGSMFGKQTGDAQFDVPSAKLTVDQTVDALKEIRDNTTGMDQNFGNIMGVPTQVVPAYPGSSMADFRNSVTRGANLAFMQAREMLRGGGQITDFESKKAESAITDMQIAMETGSKAQFLKALDDFEQAVKDGYEKLKAQAGAIPGYGGSGVTAPPAGATNVDDLLKKYQ